MNNFYPHFDREREFKVLLEEIQSQFKTFGENLTGMRDEFGEFREEVRDKLDKLDVDVTSLKTAFRILPSKDELQTLEKRIQVLER